jgi:hypothetical protein
MKERNKEAPHQRFLQYTTMIIMVFTIFTKGFFGPDVVVVVVVVCLVATYDGEKPFRPH